MIKSMRISFEYTGRLAIAFIVLFPFIWVVTSGFTKHYTIAAGSAITILVAAFSKDIYKFFEPLMALILILFISQIAYTTVPDASFLRLCLDSLPLGLVLAPPIDWRSHAPWLQLPVRNWLYSKTLYGFSFTLLLTSIFFFEHYFSTSEVNVESAFRILGLLGLLSVGYAAGCLIGSALLSHGLKSFFRTTPYLKRIALPVLGFSVGHFCIMLWFAFLFNGLYWTNPKDFDVGKHTHFTLWESLWESLYLSMNSILPASASFGHVQPVSLLVKSLVSVETFLGVIWIVAVFAGIVEYARRDSAKV